MILAADATIDFDTLSLLEEAYLVWPPSISNISTAFLPQLDNLFVSTFRDDPAVAMITPLKYAKGQLNSKDVFSTESYPT